MMVYEDGADLQAPTKEKKVSFGAVRTGASLSLDRKEGIKEPSGGKGLDSTIAAWRGMTCAAIATTRAGG